MAYFSHALRLSYPLELPFQAYIGCYSWHCDEMLINNQLWEGRSISTPSMRIQSLLGECVESKWTAAAAERGAAACSHGGIA